MDKDWNFIAEFNSAKEAQKITGIFASSIGRVCQGKGQLAGKFRWKYKNNKYDI